MSARQEEPCITLETEWGKNDVDKELVKQKFEESEETEVTDDKGTKIKKFKKISGYVRTFMGNNVERLINTTWLDFHQVETARKISNTKTMSTLAGNLKTTEVVTLRKIKLPEFDKTKTVDEQKALVFDMPCLYDIILGSDFLFKAGIEIKYSDATVEWFEHTIPMRDPLKFDDEDFAQLIEQLSVQEDDEFFGEDFLDSYLVQNIFLHF